MLAPLPPPGAAPVSPIARRAYPVRISLCVPLVVRAGLETLLTPHLDRVEVLAVLRDDAKLEDVRADQAQAMAYGINGVPFFVIDGKYGVSGAQDPAAFEQVLRQVVALRADASADVAATR